MVAAECFDNLDAHHMGNIGLQVNRGFTTAMLRQVIGLEQASTCLVPPHQYRSICRPSEFCSWVQHK